MTSISAGKLQRFKLVALAACAMSALASGTLAGEQRIMVQGATVDAPPSARVRFDDLDLSTEQGSRVLYQRISVAARLVCPDVYSRDLATVIAARHCEAQAIDRAVRTINSPQLALVHEAHSRHG